MNILYAQLKNIYRKLVSVKKNTVSDVLENPLGKYLLKTAANHGYSVVKARSSGAKLQVTFQEKKNGSMLQPDAGKVQMAQSLFSSGFDSLACGAEFKDTGMFQIDQAIRLGDKGLLLFGWSFSRICLKSITICAPDGSLLHIHDRLFSLFRPDAVKHLQEKFPEVKGNIGFCCLAPMPAKIGDQRILCVEYLNGEQLWLRLPETRLYPNMLDQAMDIFSLIQRPEKMRHRLFELVDQCLAPGINAIKGLCVFEKPVIKRYMFGRPVKNPDFSVVIPLFGRFDFIRYQLAHFADDPDFETVDLIYVVDDPSIIQETLDMAERLFEVFGVSFRVLTYNDNLGYAAANNIGAQHACGKNLLLLNSDVIPDDHGWLGRLNTYLYDLPNAGAVAPLLLYHDDAVQHAGMAAKYSNEYPGFTLNGHPGKGLAWCGGNDPVEQQMLTGACLLLRRDDYLDIGGLDEGYLLGDFEDSDLCFTLRRKGKSLWLIPQVKMRHLERKSQNMHIAQGNRLLVTLYNSHRYGCKIAADSLADSVREDQ